MKAISYTVLFIFCLQFTSCKKENEEPIAPIVPEVAIALNQIYKPSASDSLFVNRSKTSTVLQVSAISNASTEMKRIYVFKKTWSVLKTGDYLSYADSSLKRDVNGNYYYAIPNDQRFNTVLNLNVLLGIQKDTSIIDAYYFAITGNTDFINPANPNGILVGPAHINIVYGLVTQTKGYKIFNPKSKKSNAFDLALLTNKKTTDTAPVKDMNTLITTDSLWKKSFTAGTSQTLFVKVPAGFNDTHVTDLELKKIFQQAFDPLSIQSNVSSGDLFIAQLRGKQNYALVKITAISDENLISGQGKDSEYMEFSIFK